MSEVPHEFRQRIAEHNRSCWMGALLSLLGAGVAWLLAGMLYMALVLLSDVIRTGETDLFKPPVWCFPVGGALLGWELILGLIDRWKRKYRPPSDRMIIGWHLFSEVLLIPARTTFAIFDHLAARIRLSQREEKEAWSLLLAIFEMERADTTRLARDYPNGRRLQKLLLALQLADWIDLHRGDEDWFYKVTSVNEPWLRKLTRGEVEDPERVEEGET